MLNRLDRYFLGQLMGPFGFFSLVIVGILWLAQALPLVDQVISSGQSGLVFLEITSYLVPRVLMVALPVAAFSAALYTLNRLYTESELVVMMTSGQSPLALARPVVVFGLIAMTMMMAVTLYLVPASQTQLTRRLTDFRSDFAKTLVKEGQFIHPSDGLTLFIKDTSKQGEMAGLFISDSRNEENPIIYTAQRAVLLQAENSVRILMFDGIIQRLATESNQLSIVHFDEFSYDIGALLTAPVLPPRNLFERFVPELLWPDEELRSNPDYTRGDLLAEANHKLVMPLGALVLPMIALGTILVGGFRRGGFMGRVIFAIVIGVAVQSSTGMSKAWVKADATLFPVMYMPALIGLAIALFLLHRAGRVPRRKREAK